MSKPIAITCGDPSGIGPKIIQEWFEKNPKSIEAIHLLGPEIWLEAFETEHKTAIGDNNFKAIAGEPSAIGAQIAMDALEEAAYGCRQGRYRAVVTAPISKEQMSLAGWKFKGQTEFFSNRWHGEASMGFAGEKMRMVLVTTHIPLREIPDKIDAINLSRSILHLAELLERMDGNENPKIGVCGLNPHAGEGGILGYEETSLINPILEDLRKKYPNLSNCQAADTLFIRHLNGEFDGVIALYHDQGLVALKTLEFDSAVNITLGLPFIRTSPDHGTAFECAKSGQPISIKSFSNAVKIAQKLSPRL